MQTHVYGVCNFHEDRGSLGLIQICNMTRDLTVGTRLQRLSVLVRIWTRTEISQEALSRSRDLVTSAWWYRVSQNNHRHLSARRLSMNFLLAADFVLKRSILRRKTAAGRQEYNDGRDPGWMGTLDVYRPTVNQCPACIFSQASSN